MQRFLGLFSCWRSTQVVKTSNIVTKLEENVRVKDQFIMEGYLFKRTSKVFKIWNRHWFVIQNNQLMRKKMFKRNHTVVIKDLKLCMVTEFENSGRQFCFQVVSPTKTCILQADSEEKKQAWIRVIKKIIANQFSSRKLTEKYPDLCVQRKLFSNLTLLPTLYEHKDTQKDSQQENNISAGPSVTVERRQKETFIQRTYSASKESFKSQYTVGQLLGEGGFSCVYEGFSNIDGKQIAIKYLKKDTYCRYIIIPGETEILPIEVALMHMVGKPPRCKHVLELLEWFKMPNHFLLILEQPVPCVDLYQFRRGKRLQESVTKNIMQQVVEAAQHCRNRGIVHRDIKEENILINANNLEVKLIDFGCGDLLISHPYKTFLGTMEYCPPEWITNGKYGACSGTVWSLGVLLFLLVCGKLPFHSARKIVLGHLNFPYGVSESCQNLISSCLDKDPYSRPSFEMILQHHWFKE